MSWSRFGPEWNPVLVVLGVLAVLCVLALVHWWLGLIGLVGVIVGLLVARCTGDTRGA